MDEPALLRFLLNEAAGERSPGNLELFHLVTPVDLRRRGVEAKLVLRSNSDQCPAVDEDLLKLLGQAHLWFSKLEEGEAKSARALALNLNIDPADFGRMIQLVFLAPHIEEAILGGRQPVELTPRRLTHIGVLPLDWADQHRLLGLASR